MTDASARVIDVEGIWFQRGQRDILSDVTWRVEPGENWAIVGANGSGKTTLLRLALGYIWPSRGQVSVLGEQFGHTDLRQLRKRIGWVSSALQPMLRARQVAREIVLSGAFASTGLFDEPSEEQRLRAAELIDQLSCHQIADCPFQQLSLGEQQRVLIARSLMASPELLILDEPCAGLDITAREALLDRLEHLAHQADAASLVYVTHHIEEIPRAFSHVLVIREGRVMAHGPKGDVLTDEVLSEAFGLSIEVNRRYGRFWPHVRSRL
jgi:iron complex transport system ATP-binding protein